MNSNQNLTNQNLADPNLTDHLIPPAMQQHILQKLRAAIAAKQQRVASVNRQHAHSQHPESRRRDLQRRINLEPTAIQATYHLRCETCDEEFSVTGIFTSYQQLIRQVLHQHNTKCRHCTSPRIVLNHQVS